MKYLFILFFIVIGEAYSQNYKIVKKQEVDKIKSDPVNEIPSFVLFGISDQSNSNEAVLFREKFGIGFRFENCVVLPNDLKKAKEANKEISKVLIEKFGTTWYKELPFSVPGIENI